MAFIFYDTETTGTDPAFDQILQIAAIRTDENLEITDSFDLRCRLRPYVIPSIGALLITGVSLESLASQPLSPMAMMQQVRTRFETWSRGGAVFAGWNSLSFDEEMLRQGFYQTLLPVFLSNTFGNGRADIMRMAQMTVTCRPGVITPGAGPEGRPSYRLGLLAAANGIVLDNAHDALADTMAALEVARRIKAGAPDLWDRLIANTRRGVAQRIAEESELLFLAESRFGNTSSAVVAPLGPIGESGTTWAMFDLSFDPVPFAAADDASLASMLAASPRPVRRAPLNKQPGLLPVSFTPETIAGGRLPLELYRARAASLREHAELRRRILTLMASAYADRPESAHVEERIYAGFASSEDQLRLVRFHMAPPDERPFRLREIEDARYRQLGMRLIASENPEQLTEQERVRWTNWLRDRLHATGVPWRTLASVQAELDELDPALVTAHGPAIAAYRSHLAALAALG